MRQRVHHRGLVSEFVDSRQRAGVYSFTGKDLAAKSTQSPTARRAALNRLHRRGRIVRPLPRHDFFVIVPHEHHSLGSPPLAWYLDGLMRFLGVTEYYVGLLTAAQWHGASHFAVQETQIVAPRQLRPVRIGRERIRFFTKRTAASAPVETRTLENGIVRVSTPEGTAVDLVRYAAAAGGLNLVASVLTELSPRLHPRALLAAANKEANPGVAQRLGHLLDRVAGTGMTGPLARWVAARQPRVCPLEPGTPITDAALDERWRVQVNLAIETGL